jgi:type IV fimbrial biogenesis protein FimT
MQTAHISNQQGATLTETLVVVVIIGILAGVAIPTYMSQIPQSRLNGAARQVMSDFMLARRQAVSQMQRVIVCFPDTDTQQYKIYFGGGTVDDCKEKGQSKNIQENYQGVTMHANSNPIFDPRGTVTPTTTITLFHAGIKEDSYRCVKISSAGRVRIAIPEKHLLHTSEDPCKDV